MSAGAHDPVTVWRFIRRYFVRIVIGAVLVTGVYFAISVYATYQREQRIAKEFEALDGSLKFQYCGPNWIPKSIRERTPIFNRIRHIGYSGVISPDGGGDDGAITLTEMGSLTHLESLNLGGSHITDAVLEKMKGLPHLSGVILSGPNLVSDAGLEHLKGLRSITGLFLDDTEVTDAGLEHLWGLTSLRTLLLDGTQTTAEGRALLRKALPGCQISPNP